MPDSAGGASQAQGSPKDRYDVAILGGGLAGLSLGLQLRQTIPDASIFIAEKRKGPAPLAAFKVGESTVENSAHYFGEILGLRDHLRSEQLPKNGLRFFFPAGDNSDITQRVEWGTKMLPPVPSFQLDRGKFENFLAERNEAEGTDRFDGCTIQGVELSEAGDHTVRYEREGQEGTLTARWVVDASGITMMLKKMLGLHKDVEHKVNSAWFRLGGGLDLDEWGADDERWLGRMEERGIRGLSTNHLMGEGYWVWLIPLSSGPISIGIVADPRFHPWDEINTLDGAIDWLKRHEPQLAADVDARRDQIEDFAKVENFAYSCSRVFSPERWAMTGISGCFADPFYSPGSDFIAQANIYITDLIKRDLAGEEVFKRAAGYNAAFLSAFETLLRSVYTNQYHLWGNAEVMCAKVLWEFAVYWVNACVPVFFNKLTDLDFNAAVRGPVRRMISVSSPIEQMFVDWHQLTKDREYRDVFIANKTFAGFYKLHEDLYGDFDDEGLKQKFEENADLLEATAVIIFAHAVRALPDQTLDEDVKIKPSAISLHPERWEKAGLFGGSGWTVAEAREMTPGLEDMLLDSIAQPA
jgi:flavin-dependent dehydrogenase